MKTAIITTTVYRPDNLLSWGRCLKPNDVVVVAGDKKTPHADVRNVLDQLEEQFGVTTTYALESGHPGRRWAISDVVGWHSIQRRNIAILEALLHSPDTVITVDTDNYPVRDTHVTEVNAVLHSSWQRSLLQSSTGWFNVGETLTPQVIHRGYPLKRRLERPDFWNVNAELTNVGVHASFWYGDPDVDAIERIHSDPQIARGVAERQLALHPGTWCPFNSQATAWHRDLLPLLHVWPFIGRMDDIWPSYVARHIMDHFGYVVVYGRPFVIQERHPHDLVRDLEGELIGYRFTDSFADVVRDVDLTGAIDAVDALSRVYAALTSLPFIGDELRAFWFAWLEDVRVVAAQLSNTSSVTKQKESGQ